MSNSPKPAKKNKNRNKSKSSNDSLIDTVQGISSVLDALRGLPTMPPSLYIDLEGVNLSRHGTISILQIYVSTTRRTYLIDVATLGEKAFSTPGVHTPDTLTSMLQSPLIPKVFFDVRNDSDALFSRYGIRLEGVHDIQLLELASRWGKKTHIKGLQSCMDDLPMTKAEREGWDRAKEKGKELFRPEKGGSYEVFNQRPLRNDIIKYCVQDVQYLPRLWTLYHEKIKRAWAVKAQKAAQDRVLESQAPDFDSNGPGKTRGPSDWAPPKKAATQETGAQETTTPSTEP
ncbi:hypothetical protein ONZ43_g1008 [Nemania bipapillata]|uniref:Uncharacterized protein n=1 Tax=Nemania bipapillata TaxID=110536 RepID=A0ACC2J5Y8_9PEZI|nr:hypothetical protein ONZ43_g1008 [Nemania bipapillata]